MRKTCKCGQPGEGWPGNDGGELCQMCWEAECSESWWQMVEASSHLVFPEGESNTEKRMELTKEHYERAAIAYNAYCKQTGGKSLVSGDKLPEFDTLRQQIKDAWAAAAIAVSLHIGLEADRAILSLTERAKFGDQCYQDRCENAYVEQTVMKRALDERALRCAAIAQEVIDGLDGPDTEFEFACDIYQPIQRAIRREFGLERGLDRPTNDPELHELHGMPGLRTREER